MCIRKCVFLIGLAMLGMPAAVMADDWQFRLTPYLWFAGLEGDVTPVASLPSVPVDVSPSQAVKDTDAGVMVMFDARRGHHGLYLDFIYTDVRSDEDIVPELDLSVRTVTKSTMFTAAYEYQVLAAERGGVDALLGARYWEVDSKLSLSGPLGLSGQNKEDWIDPFVGAKGWTMFGASSFYFAGGAAIGGLGAGSDLFYEINANVGYRWTNSIGTSIGYRYFNVDYDHSSFKYDVEQQGWQVGLTWMF